MPETPTAKQAGSRGVLLAGFGALLLLMAVAGFDTIRLSHRIQAHNDQIRKDFLLRSQALEEIRADVYLSGTYVRDYLTEPDPERADEHRTELEYTHRQMDAALDRYSHLIGDDDRTPFQSLRGELRAYWQVLAPALAWGPGVRRLRASRFLHNEVLPRREAMLAVADRIAAINARQWSRGDLVVASIFSSFRMRLGVALAMALALGALFAGFTIRKMLLLQRAAATQYAEVVKARAELKELSARLVDAQENERRAISRELHDEVGQSLSAALVELGNLSTSIRMRGDADMLPEVERVKRLVETSVHEVRNLALLLRPSMLDDFGLIPALQWQAREVSRRTGLVVKVAAEQVSEDLPEEHKTCVYRMVQEALHNCARHAGATLVRVTVREDSGRLLISVQDDGKGFDTHMERGLGLLGMQERVLHLGGTFGIRSEPGKGTVVAAELPLVPVAQGPAAV